MDDRSGQRESRDQVAHPLQDVDLGPAETHSEGSSTKTVAKNWVKFDDDVGGGEVLRQDGSNSQHVIDGAPRSIVTSAVAAAEPTTTATTPNKLSPPPRKKPIAATATTATTPTTAPTPAAMNTNTNAAAPVEQLMNKHAAAVAPVQRPTVTSSTAEAEVAPAVLATESTHVNLNASSQTQQHPQHLQVQQSIPKPSTALNSRPITSSPSAAAASSLHGRHVANNGASGNKSQSIAIPVESTPPMRTIELSTGRIREGFANGDVIVTLLPANSKWPWITPAIFRPELVPEELMAQGLTLTVEDYVHAMETLVNDYRFTVYNICYKRILVCWILFAFGILLTLLFSGLKGVALFSLGVGWLFLNAAAIFLCMWLKLRLARGLEKCLARVNKQLMRHNILLILDDRGRISCHKVNLCFLYFDAAQCVNFLNEFLEHTEKNGGEAIKAGWEAKLDLDLSDIVIQGSNPVRLSRKQAVAQELFLSYLQRWGKDFLRRRLDWTVQEAGVHETPRHLQSSICPCQYEEELLRNKIKTHLQRKQCCGVNCIGCWL